MLFSCPQSIHTRVSDCDFEEFYTLLRLLHPFFFFHERDALNSALVIVAWRLFIHICIFTTYKDCILRAWFQTKIFARILEQARHSWCGFSGTHQQSQARQLENSYDWSLYWLPKDCCFLLHICILNNGKYNIYKWCIRKHR